MAEARRAERAKDGDVAGTRILVVEARFYDDIADALLAGARRVLEAEGVAFDRISVPDGGVNSADSERRCIRSSSDSRYLPSIT